MECQPLGHQASRAFYLGFRRWCIANSVIETCSAYRSAHTRAVESIKLDGTVRARSIQDIATRFSSRGAQHATALPGFHQNYASARHYRTGRVLRNSKAPAAGLDQDLRKALRTLTRPCVVVTASIPGSNAWTGATLSSFDTISLDPVPQVSFNIKVPSRTYEAFSRSGDVCVHILSASPRGALIADTFTKQYEDSNVPFQLLQRAGCTFTRGRDGTAPKLYIEGGVLARLICKRDEASQEISVGDHKLCTLTVVSVEHTAASHDQQHALAYGQQAFRALGRKVEPSIAADVESVIAQNDDLDDRDLEPAFKTTSPHRTTPTYASRPASPLTATRSGDQPRPSIASAGFHTSSRQLVLGGTRGKLESRHILPTEQSVPVGTTVSSETMQQTVEDFLCHSQTRHAPRTAQLRDARRLALQAQYSLDQDEVDQTLGPQERQDLTDIVARNERFIARRLAFHAANDLNDMLDKGRVSLSRVQYIEKCIEAGQAALLHEAQDFADGKPRVGFSKAFLPDDVDAFETLDTHLQTALMRLRDLHEEEDMD